MARVARIETSDPRISLVNPRETRAPLPRRSSGAEEDVAPIVEVSSASYSGRISSYRAAPASGAVQTEHIRGRWGADRDRMRS